MAAHIEVNVFVGEELKCQVFITDEQKEIDLTTTRNDVLQVVKDFFPLTSYSQSLLENKTVHVFLWPLDKKPLSNLENASSTMRMIRSTYIFSKQSRRGKGLRVR